MVEYVAREDRRSHDCPITIKLKIQELLDDKDMSPEQLAETAKLARSTIINMTNNPYPKRFDVTTLSAIIYALDLQLSDLVEVVIKSEPDKPYKLNDEDVD